MLQGLSFLRRIIRSSVPMLSATLEKVGRCTAVESLVLRIAVLSTAVESLGKVLRGVK